jgi:predicted CoA-binding protein
MSQSTRLKSLGNKEINSVSNNYKTIAVVGLSKNPLKPAIE